MTLELITKEKKSSLIIFAETDFEKGLFESLKGFSNTTVRIEADDPRYYGYNPREAKIVISFENAPPS